MVPVICPGESLEPIGSVTSPRNSKEHLMSFPLVPHLSLGSYFSLRYVIFNFKLCFCDAVLSWHHCVSLESTWIHVHWRCYHADQKRTEWAL